MTNIYVTVRGTHVQATAHGCLTSGMIGVAVKFEYNGIWNGLHKTAVFSAGGVTRDVVDISDSCTVPAEVLAKAGTILYVGVYGWRDDGTIVIPTIMAPVGMIAPGADPSGDPGTDPGLPIWAQLQQQIKDLQASGPVGGGGASIIIDPDGYLTTTSGGFEVDADGYIKL